VWRAGALTAVGLFLGCGAGHAAPPPPEPCNGCYVPRLATSFQWNLGESDDVDTSVDAELFDIDWEDASRSVVARLKARGRKVFCYISAGSWENFRSDRSAFPRQVVGRRYAGYRDERWLDVRHLDVLVPIMLARMQRCKRKGFDGVQLDNVDGFSMPTGFPISAEQQLTYNATLANAAHRMGLGAALENDPLQAQEMMPYFDWVIYELDRDDTGPCFYSSSCKRLDAFRAAGKATFVVEYRSRLRHRFCRISVARGFNGILKKDDLGPYRHSCPRPAR
jgi:endo-alpha-1,4-polygalactosaminidase (GH114 family)